MFARLFNNIGPRSLVNASILALTIILFFWFKPLTDISWSPSSQWTWSHMGSGTYFGLLLLVSFVLAIAFNEWQNRLHLFQLNYYYFLFSFLGILCSLYLWGFSEIILVLPILFALLWRCQPAINPKTDFSRFNFGLGMSISLLALLIPEAIYLVLIPLLLGLFFSGLSLRSFMALSLGLGSIWYFGFTLDYFFDTAIMESFWGASLKSWQPLTFTTGNSLWTKVALGLYSLISALISFAGLARYNQEQKRMLGFWLLLLLISIAGFAFLSQKGLWLSVGIGPFAFFASRAIQTVDNKWMKESLFLMPFLIYLLGVLL